MPGRIDFWLCAGCDCGHVVSNGLAMAARRHNCGCGWGTGCCRGTGRREITDSKGMSMIPKKIHYVWFGDKDFGEIEKKMYGNVAQGAAGI